MSGPHAPVTGGALRRVQDLFEGAVELPHDAREAFLERRCGEDRRLFELTLRLLAAHEGMGDFLEHGPLGDASERPLDDDPVPPRIGRYEIVRVVGSGGMGIVYEARQKRPHRKVALKVVHPALISPRWLKRFEREGELLGRLHHPGIGTIYEAGSAKISGPGRSATMQPFLAMEFIEGRPLDAYARSSDLDTRGRMELAAKICDAIQHAHEHGIVHRDLKPSNILVEDGGQPKVLDFGVALATGAEWQTLTVGTASQYLVGTIPYMSPEQVGGKRDQVGVESDVYALGVVLYELISGRLPIETKARSLPQALRAIQEEDPQGLGSLDSAWRGDIDAIVAKALRKEKNHRYASAGDLADDIRRYLRGEPILARRPSKSFHLRRFARRNKALVAGVAATILTLALGVVVASVFARREVQQRRFAEAATAEAERSAHGARFAVAINALTVLDPSSAARNLDAVPERHRSWEWRHLRWRAGMHLDESPPLEAERPRDYLWSHLRRISPDGNLMLFDAGDAPPRTLGQVEGRFLAMRDLRSGRELWRRPGAHSMRGPFSPDGSVVAVGEWSAHAILILDARTGELRDRCELSDHTAVGPAYSRSGKRLSYYDNDLESLCIWSFETRRAECTPIEAARLLDESDPVIEDIGVESLYMNDRGILTVRSSPGGEHVLFSGAGGTMVRRVGDRRIVGVLGTRSVPLGWSTDGTRVITDEPDGSSRTWSAWTDARPMTLHNPHRRRTEAVALSPDDRLLATAGWRFVTLHDLRTGGERWNAYDLEPWTGAMAFSPDGRWLAVGGPRGPIDEFPGGGWLADALDSGVVNILDVSDGSIRHVRSAPSGNVVGLHWTADGAGLWIATREGALRLVDTETGTATEADRPEGEFLCRTSAFEGARIASAGELRVDGPPESSRSAVIVRDAVAGRVLEVLEVDGGPIARVALDAAGERVAVVTDEGELVIVDLITGERASERHERAVFRAVGFTRDGKRVISVTTDGKIVSHDTAGRLDDVVLDSGMKDVLASRLFHDGSSLLVVEPMSAVLLETGPPPEGFKARALAREARELVNAAYRNVTFSDDVARELRSMPRLPEDVLSAALELARARDDHVGWLESDAIYGYRNRGRSDQTQTVLRKAERAFRLQPDRAESLATLGKCRYRAGMYRAALASLRRAGELRRSTGAPPSLEDLAFDAMTRWQLGDHEAARRTIREIDALAADAQHVPRPVLESIIEARTLIH